MIKREVLKPNPNVEGVERQLSSLLPQLPCASGKLWRLLDSSSRQCEVEKTHALARPPPGRASLGLRTVPGAPARCCKPLKNYVTPWGR